MSSSESILKPGEILFEEGDQSNHLFLIKSGMVRVFKRKAEGNIEIDTIRPGEVVGELSFFDSRPRSASAEALTTVQLIQIPRAALDEVFKNTPDWMVSLTRMIAARLRTANDRLRALETVSSEYETDRQGNRSRDYHYITATELIRFCSALLAVGSRYGQMIEGAGTQIEAKQLEAFAVNYLQLHSNKVTSLIEIFKSVDLLRQDLILSDIRFLDALLPFLSQQNMLRHEQRKKLSDRGFLMLKAVTQNRSQAQKLEGNRLKLNVGPILKTTALQPSNLNELVQQGFIQSLHSLGAGEIWIEFDGTFDLFYYRTFWLLGEVDKLNDQKRRSGS